MVSKNRFNIVLMNEPQFEIYGDERRKLKRDLAQLKCFVKDFWYRHQTDVDMGLIHNCETSTFSMSDDTAQEKYDKAVENMATIEKDLSKLYKK